MSSFHRTVQGQLVITGLAALLAGAACIASAQSTTISIQAGQPAKPISPQLFGMFFEDLNYAADVGHYAELIQNGSFEYGPTEPPDRHALKCWELQKLGGLDGKLIGTCKVENTGGEDSRFNLDNRKSESCLNLNPIPDLTLAS